MDPLLVIRATILAILLAVPAPLAAQPTGWRLMMPSFDDAGRLPDEQDPDRWHQVQAFDSARECEVRRGKLVTEAAEITDRQITQARPEDQNTIRGYRAARLNARCLPFLPPAARAVPDHPDSSALFRQVASGVVTITSYGPTGSVIASGSATLLFPGVAVTNVHVVRGASTAYATLRSGKRTWVAGVLGDDAAADLVLLQLGEDRPDAVALGMAREIPAVGQRVYALGAPSGLGWSLSEGIVSAVRSHATMGPVIQFTAPVSRGSSGGPLLNARGEVVGIVTFLIDGGQNLNFAVPVKAVRALPFGDAPVALREWRFGGWIPARRP